MPVLKDVDVKLERSILKTFRLYSATYANAPAESNARLRGLVPADVPMFDTTIVLAKEL